MEKEGGYLKPDVASGFCVEWIPCRLCLWQLWALRTSLPAEQSPQSMCWGPAVNRQRVLGLVLVAEPHLWAVVSGSLFCAAGNPLAEAVPAPGVSAGCWEQHGAS